MAKTNQQTAGKKPSPAKKREAATRKAAKPAEQQKVSREKLAALRKPVEEAKGRLDAARKEAQAVEEKARAAVAQSKEAYLEALVPYREACRKSGANCEYEGGRTANVSERVSFLVEKTDKGVRVMVKGKPRTEEVIPMAVLKESINKAAYSFVERHLGPREKVGNKGGSLSNRLRAVLA